MVFGPGYRIKVSEESVSKTGKARKAPGAMSKERGFQNQVV